MVVCCSGSAGPSRVRAQGRCSRRRAAVCRWCWSPPPAPSRALMLLPGLLRERVSTDRRCSLRPSLSSVRCWCCSGGARRRCVACAEHPMVADRMMSGRPIAPAWCAAHGVIVSAVMPGRPPGPREAWSRTRLHHQWRRATHPTALWIGPDTASISILAREQAALVHYGPCADPQHRGVPSVRMAVRTSAPTA